MVEHTPTPWKANFNLIVGDGKRLGSTFAYGGNADANAAFIVRAVNAHDDLVEALTWAMMQIPGYTRRLKQNEGWCDAYDAAKATLSKAAS